MHDSMKNMMFLLSAAPMGMAGCLVTVNTDAGTSLTTDTLTSDSLETGSGDGDGDQTGDGDGDGDPTTGDGDGDPTGDGDGDPATGDGDGDGDPTGDGDGDGDPTTGDGDGDGDACAAYATFYADCIGQRYYQENLEYCTYALEQAYAEYGPDCQAAVEAVFTCISTLTCDEFDNPPYCVDEAMAAAVACGA
jgi:hypothetical protein